MQQKKLDRKYVLAALAVVIIIAAIINIFSASSHIGKIGVTVEVAPADSTITVDGKASHSGKVFLSSGEHTFVASKSGFKDDKETKNISSSMSYVGLLPSPDSVEARKWVDNEENASIIEGISGSISSAEGALTSQKNPLINYLPQSDITGPYTISYSLAAGINGDDATIIIKNSTSDGRIKAIKWIQSQGFDPTTMHIVFEDFQNPLESGD